MDSSIFLDAIRLINSSTSVLLVLPQHPSLDCLSAGVSLRQILHTEARRVDLFSPEYTEIETTRFVTNGTTILPHLVNLREFIIRVGLGSATLESLRYETSDKELRLMLLPKQGYFESKDVQLSAGSFAYDLIITLGVQQIQDLGVEAVSQKEFFSHTPIIAIDHQPSHQPYGQITLLDTTATSVSEIVAHLFQQQPDFSFHEGVATTLLAGIMSGTSGFQAHTVTPKALAAAAALLTAGARRDVVVQNLFQTKTLPVLQLWGRALAKLQRDTKTGVAYTIITKEDMRVTKTSPSAAIGLLEELLATAQESAVVLALEIDTGTQANILLRDIQYQPQFPDDVHRVSAQYTQAHVSGAPAEAIATILNWWKEAKPGR